MLIFVLQTIWLYIAELAGKDLDIATIGKFLLYLTPTLIPLILPLTILLASIMVFGNFAENYEFAAMKSTGISLQRAMRSLSAFIIILGITTFFFSNNIIPEAQKKSYNLRKNIAKLKPAMAIAEGQFNQIGSMNIKVSEKSGDRGQYLKDVVIHKSNNNSLGNHTVILSETGEFISSEESDVLKLVLYDGNYYDDIQSKDFKQRRKKPFVKSEFKEYIINIDLSQINGNVDLDQKNITSKYNMLSVKNLDYTIDSLRLKEKNKIKEFTKNIYARATVSIHKKDSISTSETISDKAADKITNEASDAEKDYMAFFDTRQKIQIVDTAINKILATTQVIDAKDKELSSEQKWKNKHIIAYHEKFALGFACIILFFIGAPLGALIKKGGLGLPMVIAIVFFLIYHFLGIFAKNSAEDGSLNPALASWLSTLIMFPISIYLTTRATKDRGLFDVDLLLQPIIKALGRKDELVPSQTVKSITNEEREKYKTLENDQIIDIVRNYRQYGYDSTYKDVALNILKERGIEEKQLRFKGKFLNENYENAYRFERAYSNNSLIALKFYLMSILLILPAAILTNNGFPELGLILYILGNFLSVFYMIFLFRSFVKLSDFYKITGNKSGINIYAMLILGLPFYFLMYFYYKKKMKEDLKLIR